MEKGLETLRRLAWEYAGLAHSDRYQSKWALHRAVNDRRMIRPVVLIDEVPWHEMDFDGSLTPVCDNPVLRELETTLRRTLYRHRHFPADMLVPPWFTVSKVIHESGIGIGVKEEVLATDAANNIIAHEYHDQLEEEESLEKLHPTVVTYDREETMARLALVCEAVGDILPVRLSGVGCFYSVTWDNISRYRGVTPLLMDLAERPEYSSRMADLLTGFEEERLRQYEELGLLDPHPLDLHCTAALVSDLPGGEFDGVKATRRDIWGRGAAQIFASVSPAMHQELDIQSMKRTIGSCGLSYYGCCEPLDTKIHVVSQLPNLRKVGVTPWADARRACEAMEGRYVAAIKPNPAAVAVSNLDKEEIRREIGQLVKACRDFNCSCDIVLKDISTCNNRPQNIFDWEQAAMEAAVNA